MGSLSSDLIYNAFTISFITNLTIHHSFLSSTLSLLVVVWRKGSALVSINEVNIRRAQVELGWVTVSGFNSRCGHLSRYVTSHPGQLSLAIPLWVGAVNTSQRAVMPCGWGVKAGTVRVWVASKTV